MTIPGIHTAIIGTGHIDTDPAACQLQQNLLAAQIAPNALSVSDQREIEKMAGTVKEGKTNYFQAAAQPLGAPRNAAAKQEMRGQKRMALLNWQTAYAGDEPIVRYEIWRDNQKAGQLAHKPQVRQTPFAFEEVLTDKAAHHYQIVTVDAAGRTAKTGGCSALSGLRACPSNRRGRAPAPCLAGFRSEAAPVTTGITSQGCPTSSACRSISIFL